MRILGFAVLGLALVGLVSSSGCGGSKNTLSGKATYGGKDLTKGRVILHFDGNKKAEGQILEGKYVVDNVPVGTAKITVEVPDPPPGTIGKDPSEGIKKIAPPKDTKDVPPPADKATKVAEAVPIPAKYKDVNTSGLTVTTKGGQETHDLNLQ